MDLLESQLQQLKPTAKPITLQRYIQNIKKLNKVFDNDELTYLSRPDFIFEYLNTKAENTQKGILNAIIVCIQAMNKYTDKLPEYIERRDELNKKYFENKSNNEKNDIEEKNIITTNDINNLLDELNDKIVKEKLRTKKFINDNEKTLLTEYLLIYLYSKYPLRNEFAMLNVINGKDKIKNDKNYLQMMNKKARLILNNYKTNKEYGQKVIDLDNDDFKLLKNYLKRNQDKQYLLYNKNGTPMSRNQMSHFLIKTFEKYLNKRIGTQMLRKIYLSSKYADTMKEQKKDAYIMGHSTNTAQNIYTKID